MNKHETATQLALLQRISDDLAILVAALAPAPDPAGEIIGTLVQALAADEAAASVELDHLRARPRDEHGRFLPREGVDGS